MLENVIKLQLITITFLITPCLQKVFLPNFNLLQESDIFATDWLLFSGILHFGDVLAVTSCVTQGFAQGGSICIEKMHGRTQVWSYKTGGR